MPPQPIGRSDEQCEKLGETVVIGPDQKQLRPPLFSDHCPANAPKKLRASGVRIITIANFSPKMLRSNADNSGITGLFDELLSADVNQTYKPDPKAYELGLKHLHLKKEEVVFAAFGGWDVYGAKSFGYPAKTSSFIDGSIRWLGDAAVTRNLSRDLRSLRHRDDGTSWD